MATTFHKSVYWCGYCGEDCYTAIGLNTHSCSELEMAVANEAEEHLIGDIVNSLECDSEADSQRQLAKYLIKLGITEAEY